ncbi:hypothetical protein CRG98_030965 [Punica granatum]|uniref:Reverse transcriptase RNase H-like domain-containing protein n=1 Tax=Punica granatum TaxID=22663 RepID=A0A2I0IXA9_PUNGR|nr:hypothetical protein CRG98_030965 [Punica granatum]
MCYTLVWVMQRLRQYTIYHTIRLLSKMDPLKYLRDSPSSMRNIAKWHCQLTEYDTRYVSCTSVKGQAIADHLVEFPIDDDTPINSDFPDEGIFQVSDEEESPGWKAAVNLKVKELEVFGYSMLTIFQTLKQWKTKDPNLVPYHEYLEELTKNFKNISFTYTPRNAELICRCTCNARIHAINYFTKWIEAITLTLVTAKAVACFLKRDIIAWYGVPATLITNNAKNLNNPASTGTRCSRSALAYRTSIRLSTGATPYSLVYGMEAVLPVEVEIPSMRVLAKSKLKEAEWAKLRYEQLNLIDEKRLTALCHGQC